MMGMMVMSMSMFLFSMHFEYSNNIYNKSAISLLMTLKINKDF